MSIAKRDYSGYTDLLPRQYKDAEKTKALLSIILSSSDEFFQELEALFEQGLDVDKATGYQLDIVGKLEGVYREGRTDEEYRKEIKLSRFINNGSGTATEILNYLIEFTGSPARLFDHYPASYTTEIEAQEYPEGLADLLQQLSVAGVNAHTVIHNPDGKGMTSPEEGTVFIPTNIQAGESYMQAGETQAQATPVLILDPNLAPESYESAIFPELDDITPSTENGVFPEVYYSQ